MKLPMRASMRLAVLFAAVCLAVSSQAQSPPPPGTAAQAGELSGFELTPPRLAFSDGEVSFWRIGASDWAPARVNTALASGDQLYTGAGANLELQVASRGFVRAGEQSQLGLESVEPDFVQFRVASGTVSLDLRSTQPGQTFEIDTPNAAFSVQRPGYYRVEVDPDQTRFVSRRGGTATVTPVGGRPAAVTSSEEIIVRGLSTVSVETYAAPDLDAWDRWNYARTDQQIEARSDRYLAPGVYGTDDLDRYGTWRIVPAYGAVWIPTAVPAGWAPYTTGVWMHDPFYGWVWVDSAPWGWAPYHYGRWVHVSSYWAWAPGPLVVRSYWSPALVAFFGSSGSSISVRIGISTPPVGWVALGWGEPIVPWWGPRGCLGVPRWAGWAGPRYVNGRSVRFHTTVRVQNINVYANQHVKNAVVVVPRNRFGRASVQNVRVHDVAVSRLRPVHGALSVQAAAVSRYGAPGRAAPPPRADLERRVYSLREPAWRQREAGGAPAQGGRKEGSREHVVVPAPRVAPARSVHEGPVSHRPPFGPGGVVERPPTPAPPRFEESRRRSEPQAEEHPTSRPPAAPRGEAAHGAPAPRPREAAQPRGQAPSRPVQQAPSGGYAPRAAPAPAPSQRGRAPEARPLPGEPAERVYRGPSRPSPSETRPTPRSSGPTQRSRGNGHESHRGNGSRGSSDTGGNPGGRNR